MRETHRFELMSRCQYPEGVELARVHHKGYHNIRFISREPDSGEAAPTQFVIDLVATVFEGVAELDRMEAARPVACHPFLRMQEVGRFEAREVVHDWRLGSSGEESMRLRGAKDSGMIRVFSRMAIYHVGFIKCFTIQVQTYLVYNTTHSRYIAGMGQARIDGFRFFTNPSNYHLKAVKSKDA